MHKLFFFTLIYLFSFQTANSQKVNKFLNYKTTWADSVFNSLNNDEKIAQLFMVAAYSDKNKNHPEKISELIKNYKIGGLIFFQGGPKRQADLTNYYQSISKTPLLISIDAEWGLAMRLDSTVKFPYQMSLGAIQNDSLIYKMAEEIALQCKRMGIHVNLAPVVDINNNPDNPVINFRSFGESKENVSKKALMYMNALQNNKIIANAKHFPGHGDTEFDSHLGLPIINHSKKHLFENELYPFNQLISKGLKSIMIAHLSIPNLDSTKNLASTLSKPIVTDLLKKEMGFEGLIFTDALNMKAVSKFYKNGELELKALLAGNDVLLFSEDVPMAINKIKEALKNKIISQQEIDEKCYKILKAKEFVDLNNYEKININDLIADLNNKKAELINRKLTEASLTVLQNKDSLIPVKNIGKIKIASISLGSDTITKFQERLTDYSKIDNFFLQKTESDSLIEFTKNKLKNYDLIICSIHKLNLYPRNSYGITKQMVEMVNYISDSLNSIITIFGNAYALREFRNIENSKALIITYQESENTQDLSAQLIFGAIGAKGKLPVSINQKFKAGTGILTKGGLRLKYTIPEELGINSEFLNSKIDSIANLGISKGAFPGCQVFAAKNGKVFFHKTYGFHTYDNINPVKKSDLYDFASLTKITGPLPSLMKFVDDKKLNLDNKFSSYWPDFKHSNKNNITLREVLAHYAALKEWIAFWKNTKKKNGKFKYHTFKSYSSKKYPIKIAENLYLHKNYKKKIYKQIKKSELLSKKEYKYSGLSFYLYPKIIENISGYDYETFSKNNFYKPLGAYSLTYNPLRYYSVNQIIPTEKDTFFRMQQIHGTVHDEGASMMGGVSGNAGLFGKTNDLAKLMQMYLNFGIYGGENFISKSTIKEFTKCQYCNSGNRRGLGFDKPLLENKQNGSCAYSASNESFGHSGYTGTFAWANPVNGLLYIFMSNRVFPTRDNPKIYRFNIRPAIHQIFYDALNKSN
ncbi:MAG: serine hydrolase [Bacteroidales bacterium]|nr:serine hydrolase [Bacteroidales bacterium]